MEKTTLMSLSKLFSGPGGDYIMLASESDLRAYVLRQHLGITNILMLRSDFEENLTLEDGETPYNYAVKTADEKARIVADRVFNHEKKEGHEPFRNEVRSPFGTVPDNFDFTKVKYVVGADTVCLCNDVVFGKPGDERAARDQLHAYQKYDPVMVTGVSIYVKDEHAEKKMKRISSFYERTIVHFTALNDEEINAYISTGEYKGVAGSCNYTGLGETLIEWIEGSYTAAVGIPTHQFAYEICSHLKNGDNIQYLVDGDETGVKRVRARTKRPVGEKLQAALADEIQSTAVPTSEEESESSPSESETEEEGVENTEVAQRSRRGKRSVEAGPEVPVEEGQEIVPVNEKEEERASEKGEESEEEEGETEVKSNEGSDVEAEEESGRSAKQEEEEEEEDEEDYQGVEEKSSAGEDNGEEDEEEEEDKDEVNMEENDLEQASRSRNRRSTSEAQEGEGVESPGESDRIEGSEFGSDEGEDEFGSIEENISETGSEELNLEERQPEEESALTDETENGPEDVMEEELSPRPATSRGDDEFEEMEGGNDLEMESEAAERVPQAQEESGLSAEEEEAGVSTPEEEQSPREEQPDEIELEEEV